MQLQRVKIHNFRSILDADFDLEKYSLLVGENNAGKTNIITALIIFYEDDIKFEMIFQNAIQSTKKAGLN